MGKYKAFKEGVRKFFGGEMFGDSFLWNPVSGVQGRNKRLLLREYRQYVYSLVSTIAEDVAQYEPIFYYEGKDDQDRVIPNHPFLELLHSPNPNMTQYDLFEATQSFLELTGNCFWYFEVKQTSREPVAIHIIEPHRVEICINQTTGQVDGYKVNNYHGTPIPLEKDEMLHFKMFNPSNPYWGLGTVEAGLMYIDTENQASSFQRNFLANNGMPVGAVNIKGQISSESFDKVKKQYKQQFQGPNNAGKILFTRAEELSFTKFGSSLADLDMSALKGMSQEEVRTMFRVPKAMLGASDEAGLGRANVEAIEYSYAKRTIDPKLTRIDDTIRLYVRRAYKDSKLMVDHESQIPADREALRAQAQQLTYSVLTQNESRALFDVPAIAGGDQLYVPFNMSPVGQELSATTVEAKSYGKLKVVTQKALPAVEKMSRTSYIQQLNAVNRLTERQYDDRVSKIYGQQKKNVLSRLYNKAKALDPSEVESIAPKSADNVSELIRIVMPVLVDAMEEGGTIAAHFMDPDYEYLLDKTLRDRIVEAQDRAFKGFNSTTSDDIRRTLLAGIENGETTGELAARIENVYSQVTGYRAQRIAASESNRAIVGSTRDAYSQVGVTQLEWVTDGDPCPECEAMEGTITEVSNGFIDVGDVIPGGDRVNEYAVIEGGDLHPNCMCKLIPVDNGDRAYKELVKVDRIVEVPDPQIVKELEETREYVEQLELIAGIHGHTEET